MKGQAIAAVALVAAAILGITFQAPPYKVKQLGHAGDQLVLDHRDSAY